MLHVLSEAGAMEVGELAGRLSGNMEHFPNALREIEKEGFVVVDGDLVKLR